MTAPASAFRLSEVDVAFDGRDALAGIEVSIAAGERVALVGPSGAGKTTFLRLLNGTVRPSGGRVVLDGVDLTTLSPRELRRTRSHVAFVHQDHALVPSLRVCANVIAGRLGSRGFFSSVRSMLWPARAELREAHELLGRVGIGEKLFQRTDSLSGGQRQRVAIARALFQRPTVLLADEPLASVDPARSRDLIELLTELAREHALTFVCSLHDVALAREHFPRLVGLREGRILFDAAPGELSESAFEELYRLETDEEYGGDG